MTKNWKKITAVHFFIFFFDKKLQFIIYLTLGLHKVCPSYRRSLQLSKRPSNTSKHELYKFLSTFVGHFCPPGSGSRFRIRIRIHRPYWIRIQSGSTTLKKITYKEGVWRSFFLSVWGPESHPPTLTHYIRVLVYRILINTGEGRGGKNWIRDKVRGARQKFTKLGRNTNMIDCIYIFSRL